MNVLDLFSGVGGFSLGLERAGMRTVAFCEIDPFCRAVLRKHWPNVPQYDDVRTLTAERLAADGIAVDVICGGFPCQDISVAGRGLGLAGERSGLWREYARLVGELRPRFVIVENVAALLGRGLGDVLGDLAALGYDAEWHCIPASAVGAPHRRDRIWVVAHSNRERRMGSGFGQKGHIWASQSWFGDGGANVAHAICKGREGCAPSGDYGFDWTQFGHELAAGCGGVSRRAWPPEPNVGRVAHGVPARTHRLKSLGNAVVPQIPELLGRAIMRSLA